MMPEPATLQHMKGHILVTGCAGFIGSHFSEKLLQEGFQVTGVDNFDDFYPREIKENNLAVLKAYKEFNFFELDIADGINEIKGSNFSAVVHLAAKAGVRPSIADPSAYVRANIVGTQKMHDFILDRGITKFIFASSSSVYGNSRKIPFREDDPADHPISPYAFTKRAGELMNYMLHHLHGTDVINLRFFTVYGPRQRPDLAIYKFIRQILNDEPLVLFGDGETARDYTYVDDIVQGIFGALLYCLGNSGVFETVNLGNNKPVQLRELSEIIYRLMERSPKIIFREMQPGDVDITCADISKAQRLWNYEPKIKIEEGISRFIKSLRSSG